MLQASSSRHTANTCGRMVSHKASRQLQLVSAVKLAHVCSTHLDSHIYTVL
jgi:hypothetical protein